MTLLSLVVSVRVRRLNTGLWWTTLSHGGEQNHLQLNTTKTKELVVDLRRSKKTPMTPVSILGHNVDIVEHYKISGGCSSITNWTGLRTLKSFNKKGQSHPLFSEEAPLLLTSAGLC